VTLRLVFRREAAEEAQAAKAWYDEQKPGLGARFTTALEQTLGRISSNPSAFARVHGEIRRAVVRDFPFGIYFQIHGEDVVVLAVMHGRRHPMRWRTR
jgi:plasmid stabilization system protein ParE